MHERLLFAADAARFRPLKIGRRQPRRVVKPAGQNGLAPERPGLARQNDKHGLRDVLRVLRIGRVPQRHGMDEGDVPLHQRGKGFLGTVPGELFQQPGIRHISHSPIICAPAAEPDNEFSIFRPLNDEHFNCHWLEAGNDN